MFDLEELSIEKLVVHKIGNKMRNEGIQLSKGLHEVCDSNVKELLRKYFLKSFKQESVYNFFHDSELNLNEVYFFTKKIFEDVERFYEESINILKHLYDKSNHPQIKSGEFYLVYFKNFSINSKRTDAIGIFKSENKDTYLKVSKEVSNFSISSDKGINVNKLDKGCIVFNENEEMGYKVLIVDAGAKSKDEEAQYWKKQFLNIEEEESEYQNTKAFIQICNEYSKNVHGNSSENESQRKFQFNNSAYRYLEENTTYHIDDFVEKVFDDEKSKNEFKDFKNQFEETQGIVPVSSFDISNSTVSQFKKRFKSVLKLDTGFDIKVTKPDYMEKGYDEKKSMYYYKIYYQNEI